MTQRRELPPGWQWARFDQVARVASNLTDPTGQPTALHIAPNHIESFTGRLVERSTVGGDGVTSPKHAFEADQLLYSKIRPYLGKAVIAPADGLCSADMYPIATELEVRYLLYWMLSPEFTEEVCQHQGRSVLPKVNQRALVTVGVPVAPLQEQRRIADELERRLSHVYAAERSVRLARRLLAAARRAVLCDSIKEHWPSHWKHMTIADAGESRLGLQRSPSRHEGSNMKPYLRVANVFEARIDLADVKEMHFTTDEERRYLLEPGDILLNEGQSPEFLGRPAMWTGQAHEMYFTNSLIRFRARAEVLPEWALLVFRRHMHAGRFRRESRVTTNIAHLALGRFQSVEFPLPPIDEQRLILAEVERRLSLVDAAERAIEHDLRKVGALRRALLVSAFSGRLVHQDPNDEPAATLLEQIRTQPARPTATSRSRRPRTEDGA